MGKSVWFDLKRFRVDKNLEQKFFEDLFGYRQPFVSAIENQKKKLPNDKYEILSNSFGDISGYITAQPVSANEDPTTPTKNLDRIGVPYYNVDFINGYDVIMNDQTVNPEFFINFPLYNNATCWVNASGKSMEPLITPGDIIAIRKLNDWQTYLLPGEVYAIVTTEYRTIKRILEKDADTIILVPENPDFGRKEIPKSIVLEVFQVLGCVKKVI
jgi:hypothetical protein